MKEGHCVRLVGVLAYSLALHQCWLVSECQDAHAFEPQHGSCSRGGGQWPGRQEAWARHRVALGGLAHSLTGHPHTQCLYCLMTCLLATWNYTNAPLGSRVTCTLVIILILVVIQVLKTRGLNSFYIPTFMIHIFIKHSIGPCLCAYNVQKQNVRAGLKIKWQLIWQRTQTFKDEIPNFLVKLGLILSKCKHGRSCIIDTYQYNIFSGYLNYFDNNINRRTTSSLVAHTTPLLAFQFHSKLLWIFL